MQYTVYTVYRVNNNKICTKFDLETERIGKSEFNRLLQLSYQSQAVNERAIYTDNFLDIESHVRNQDGNIYIYSSATGINY